MNSLLFRILILVLLISAALPGFSQVPKKIPADKQRALQWKPEKGQYYFSHALTFDYQNKTEKTKGSMKVFVDPVTGAMCFQKETSFGKGGKAFDFVIGFPDGRYIYCGTDENGKKIRINELVKELKPDAETKAQQKEDFTNYCVPTGTKRIDFGFESAEYELIYATSGKKDKVWLSRMPFSIYPLYGLEFLEGAVSLPVPFDYMYLMPSDLLLTEINSAEVDLKLVNFAKEPLSVSTKGYQEVKVND